MKNECIEYLKNKKEEYDGLAAKSVFSRPNDCYVHIKNIEAINTVISILEKDGNNTGS